MNRLHPDSLRRLGASRFGARLRASMKANDVGQVRLAAAVGASSASINNYRLGHNVPSVDMARRLADVLGDDQLVTLALDARRLPCECCGTVFVADTGASNRRYCSPICSRVNAKKRVGDTRERAAVAERGYRIVRDCVTVFCFECEPEGTCRDAACALRPVSPLPLTPVSGRPVGPIPAKRGHDAAWLAGVRAGNARRWTPEARRRQSEKTAARHAAMSAEERERFGAAVSAGRRRSA